MAAYDDSLPAKTASPTQNPASMKKAVKDFVPINGPKHRASDNRELRKLVPKTRKTNTMPETTPIAEGDGKRFDPKFSELQIVRVMG